MKPKRLLVFLTLFVCVSCENPWVVKNTDSLFKDEDEPSKTASYTVSFNSNGGSAVQRQKVAKNGAAARPAAPAKTGYAFAGWYTDNNAFKNKYDFSKKVTKNLTLYAKWKANAYTVAFDRNGWEGAAMAGQGFTYDIAQKLRANTYGKSGYKFAGWAETASGAVKYTDEEKVRNLTAEANATVTLYAVLSNSTYTVTFNANGGEGAGSCPRCVIISAGRGIRLRDGQKRLAGLWNTLMKRT